MNSLLAIIVTKLVRLETQYWLHVILQLLGFMKLIKLYTLDPRANLISIHLPVILAQKITGVFTL